jgi:hypothetical protein
MFTYQTEHDQETGDGGEYEHDFRLLHVVLAEQLNLLSLAHLHVLGARVAWEHKVWNRANDRSSGKQSRTMTGHHGNRAGQ